MFWGLNFLGNIVVHYNTNSWKLWGTLQRRYKDTSEAAEKKVLYDLGFMKC